MPTEIINIDAKDWRESLDFYRAILRNLGAPPEHSMSIDALIDSMIWGGINKVEAPYVIRIYNTDKLPSDVIRKIMIAKRFIADARVEAREQTGSDVDVSIEVV